MRMNKVPLQNGSLWEGFQDGVHFLCHSCKGKLKLVLQRKEHTHMFTVAYTGGLVCEAKHNVHKLHIHIQYQFPTRLQ